MSNEPNLLDAFMHMFAARAAAAALLRRVMETWTGDAGGWAPGQLVKCLVEPETANKEHQSLKDTVGIIVNKYKEEFFVIFSHPRELARYASLKLEQLEAYTGDDAQEHRNRLAPASVEVLYKLIKALIMVKNLISCAEWTYKPGSLVKSNDKVGVVVAREDDKTIVAFLEPQPHMHAVETELLLDGSSLWQSLSSGKSEALMQLRCYVVRKATVDIMRSCHKFPGPMIDPLAHYSTVPVTSSTAAPKDGASTSTADEPKRKKTRAK